MPGASCLKASLLEDPFEPENTSAFPAGTERTDRAFSRSEETFFARNLTRALGWRSN